MGGFWLRGNHVSFEPPLFSNMPDLEEFSTLSPLGLELKELGSRLVNTPSLERLSFSSSPLVIDDSRRENSLAGRLNAEINGISDDGGVRSLSENRVICGEIGAWGYRLC